MKGQWIPLSAADESFTHQAVAPMASTTHVDPRWAERCWHLLDLGNGWVLGAGRAYWRHAGRRTAVAGLSTGGTQWAVRRAVPHGDDDPNRPDVADVRIETLVPMQTVHLELASSHPAGFAFDLTWQARIPPVQTDRNRIERHGQVVTDYMNYYQSGLYTGTVRAGAAEVEITARAGFRDRGWGLRRHEGAARRGMHVFIGCELPGEVVYMLLYETATGERMFTNGWLVSESGAVDHVVDAGHALQLDGRRLHSGSVSVDLASGDRRTIAFTVRGRLFMEALGYTAVPGRGDPGEDRLDLREESVATAWEGLIDNACSFDVDGVPGHGYVEVGLGVHARYRPEDT